MKNSFSDMAAHFGSFPFITKGICDPSVQPNRLVCLDRENIAVCDGNSLHLLTINQITVDENNCAIDDGNVLISSAYSCGHHEMMQYESSGPLQSICRVESTSSVACVNAAGGVFMTSYKAREVSGIESYEFTGTHTSPRSEATGAGWAGICCLADSLATAHYMSKEISWVDTTTLQTIRSSVSTGNPTCLAPGDAAVGTESVLVTGDMTGAVCIWDARQGGRGGMPGYVDALSILTGECTGGCVHREVLCGSRNDCLWSVLPL